MSEWFINFWKAHGERHIYGAYASVLAVVFLWVGIKVPELKEFKGAGSTILIGIGMLWFNKARGNGKPDK